MQTGPTMTALPKFLVMTMNILNNIKIHTLLIIHIYGDLSLDSNVPGNPAAGLAAPAPSVADIREKDLIAISDHAPVIVHLKLLKTLPPPVVQHFSLTGWQPTEPADRDDFVDKVMESFGIDYSGNSTKAPTLEEIEK